ncbi:hypothetical protein ACJX0J_038753, partial [Zea mays]
MVTPFYNSPLESFTYCMLAINMIIFSHDYVVKYGVYGVAELFLHRMLLQLFRILQFLEGKHNMYAIININLLSFYTGNIILTENFYFGIIVSRRAEKSPCIFLCNLRGIHRVFLLVHMAIMLIYQVKIKKVAGHKKIRTGSVAHFGIALIKHKARKNRLDIQQVSETCFYIDIDNLYRSI